MFRSFYQLTARVVLGLFLVNTFSAVAVATTTSSTGLIVEAGLDQIITEGDALILDGEAYVQGLDGSASGLTEATIDWGDESGADTAAQDLEASALYLGGSHVYDTAGTYTVTVCATDGVSELTCDDLQLTVDAIVLPDLTVDSVTYNATDHAFDVTVGNDGTADVDAAATPQLSFYISYVSSALEDSYNGSFDLDTVTDEAYRTMGGSSAFSTSSDFTVDDVSYCTAYIMAVIDSANDIVELNEESFEANYYRATIDLCEASALPDLSVTGFDLQRTSDGAILDLTDPSLDLSAEDPLDYSLSATFGNISTVDVDTTTEGFNAEYGDSTEVYSYDWQSFYGGGSGSYFLSAMSTFEYEATDVLREADLSAFAELSFCIDSTNTVAESDETNNCYTVDNPFYIASESEELLPDLTITDMNLDVGWVMSTFTVANQGLATATGDGRITITIDGVLDSDFPWSGMDDTSFLVEGVSTVAYGTVLSEGTHSVEVCVDTSDVVVESDETNNCLTEELTVVLQWPDLVITSVTLNANNTLHFVIENQGTDIVEPTDAPELHFYDLTNGTGAADEIFLLNDLGSSYQAVGGTMEFDSLYMVDLSSSSVSILAVVDALNTVEELTEDVFEANYYRATFTSAASPSTSGGGGTFSTSSGSSSSSHGSSSNSDVVLTGSEDVVLTEEEVAACGEMTFLDVSIDDANYDSIYRMWCEGIIHGRDSEHFSPSDSIHRDEVSKIVSRLFGYVTLSHLELPVLTETSYTDVSTDEPLAYYVQTLTDEGFYADEEATGAFNPHEDMSFGEIVDLLGQVTGEDVSLEGYADEDSMSRGSFASFVFSYFE